jgi:hypothetical protein
VAIPASMTQDAPRTKGRFSIEHILEVGIFN